MKFGPSWLWNLCDLKIPQISILKNAAAQMKIPQITQPSIQSENQTRYTSLGRTKGEDRNAFILNVDAPWNDYPEDEEKVPAGTWTMAPSDTVRFWALRVGYTILE